MFDSYTSGDFGFVYIGNDKVCAIAGKEQTKIHMHDGVVQALCDARYVSELKKNLISVGTLHANGINCKTDGDCFRVGKGALIVMNEERNARNI